MIGWRNTNRGAQHRSATMMDVDRLVAGLGDDAAFGPDAVARLRTELGAQPSPLMETQRRTRLLSCACVALACVLGGAIGATAEFAASPSATSTMLPASADASPSSLLFGEAG